MRRSTIAALVALEMCVSAAVVGSSLNLSRALVRDAVVARVVHVLARSTDRLASVQVRIFSRRRRA